MDKLFVFTDVPLERVEAVLKSYADNIPILGTIDKTPPIPGQWPDGRLGMSFVLPPSFPNGNGAELTLKDQGRLYIKEAGTVYKRSETPKFPWDWQTAAWVGDDFRKVSTPFPVNPPTREEMLTGSMHFRGGLFFYSPDYNSNMPWYDAALTWCPPATRQLAYAAKRQAGDTHALLQIPNGFPLYDEPNQFYNAARFPALDWTNGMTGLDGRFIDMVDEIVEAGFKVMINMDEREEYSLQIVQMVMRALEPRQVPWCVTGPGYDGVFSKSHSWPPESIQKWAALARAIQPACHLFIEHGPGYIPVGGGDIDYNPGGRMTGYDLILGEYPTLSPMPTYDDSYPPDSPRNTPANETWQVLGRMLPVYHPPPQQPPWYDPSPPKFMAAGSPRGPYFYWLFETDNPYRWVRVDVDNPTAVRDLQQQIAQERQNAVLMGSLYNG